MGLVHALLADGAALKDIARRTGLSRGTVRRFARAATPRDLHHGPRASPGRDLDTYRSFLRRHWDAGTTNAAVLHNLLQAQGYGAATPASGTTYTPGAAAPTPLRQR